MLGIVGSTSLIECSVNKDYYAEQNYLIIAGVAQDCFESPNFSAVNMGPYYSSLGGAQPRSGRRRGRWWSSRPTSRASTSSTAAWSSSPRRTAWRV